MSQVYSHHSYQLNPGDTLISNHGEGPYLAEVKSVIDGIVSLERWDSRKRSGRRTSFDSRVSDLRNSAWVKRGADAIDPQKTDCHTKKAPATRLAMVSELLRYAEQWESNAKILKASSEHEAAKVYTDCASEVRSVIKRHL